MIFDSFSFFHHNFYLDATHKYHHVPEKEIERIKEVFWFLFSRIVFCSKKKNQKLVR